MTDALIDFNANPAKSEEEQALEEVRNAHNATLELESEGNAAIHQIGELTAAQSENFRRRAERQRKRGISDLDRRHSGVSSIIETIELNERAMGSAFQRNFATIENNIYVISRRAEMFVGEAAAKKLMDRIHEMVRVMDEDLKASEAQLHQRYEIEKEEPGFLIPTYTSAAATHQVQMRTKLSHTTMRIFKRYDEVLCKMQTLLWNDKIESQYIEDTELAAKRAVQKLARFTSVTLRGMFNRATGTTGRGAAPAATPALAVAA